MDDPRQTLQRLQDRLSQRIAPAQMVGASLPRTPQEAVTWARRLPGWDEYRGQYPDQVIALARVISRRALRAFGLSLTEDGRVLKRYPGASPWQTPRPSLVFGLAIRGEEVRVEYTTEYFPLSGQDHFAFLSAREPPQPHCLSETGYRSHFALHDAVEACGGLRASAALLAEAALQGEERAFATTFEGEWPKPSEASQPRRWARSEEHTV